MELNLIAAGIELVGTTIKNLTVENTIVDVEKEAKVSIATVSKALNGDDVVKATTKAKVIAAAKNLHYERNL